MCKMCPFDLNLLAPRLLHLSIGKQDQIQTLNHLTLRQNSRLALKQALPAVGTSYTLCSNWKSFDNAWFLTYTPAEYQNPRIFKNREARFFPCGVSREILKNITLAARQRVHFRVSWFFF